MHAIARLTLVALLWTCVTTFGGNYHMSDKTKREEESRRLGEMTERKDTRKPDRVDDAANADTPLNEPRPGRRGVLEGGDEGEGKEGGQGGNG